jgi:hypothetical protein
MKRVVLFVVVFVTWIAASPAFAGGPDSTSPGSRLAGAPVAIKYDFSAKAAGIDLMVPTPTRQDLRRAAAPAPLQATQPTSFWKTPWPYVIGGGVVIALVLISKNKDGGLY